MIVTVTASAYLCVPMLTGNESRRAGDVLVQR
jgi:hypothetical protein